MKKSDEEETSFTMPFGTYCYVRMPECLRNAGCTFNRTIIAVLDRNISAYVDDVVVRSKKVKTTSRTFEKPSPTFASMGSS